MDPVRRWIHHTWYVHRRLLGVANAFLKKMGRGASATHVTHVTHVLQVKQFLLDVGM
jgi:hypothetical protein